MKPPIAHLWAHHRALFVTFTLALLVTVIFAVRSVVFVVYWSDPAHRNQPLEAWMTPRYVAQSYDVPVEVVAEMLAVAHQRQFRPTLRRLARQNGTDLDALKAKLLRDIAIYKSANQ